MEGDQVTLLHLEVVAVLSSSWLEVQNNINMRGYIRASSYNLAHLLTTSCAAASESRSALKMKRSRELRQLLLQRGGGVGAVCVNRNQLKNRHRVYVRMCIL